MTAYGISNGKIHANAVVDIPFLPTSGSSEYRHSVYCAFMAFCDAALPSSISLSYTVRRSANEWNGEMLWQRVQHADLDVWLVV